MNELPVPVPVSISAPVSCGSPATERVLVLVASDSVEAGELRITLTLVPQEVCLSSCVIHSFALRRRFSRILILAPGPLHSEGDKL